MNPSRRKGNEMCFRMDDWFQIQTRIWETGLSHYITTENSADFNELCVNSW